MVVLRDLVEGFHQGEDLAAHRFTCLIHIVRIQSIFNPEVISFEQVTSRRPIVHGTALLKHPHQRWIQEIM